MHYNENRRFCYRIVNFISSLLPAIFWVLLIFSFDWPYIAVMTVIAAAIHEMGHELFLYLKFSRPILPESVLHGFKIKQENLLSYRDEALLYASGPLANAAAALLTLPFSFFHIPYLTHFCIINVATCLSNLLPIEGYDGYGIIKCKITERGGVGAGESVLGAISFSLTLSLCLISLYLIDRFGESYWVFSVFTVSLIGKMGAGLKKHNNEK